MRALDKAGTMCGAASQTRLHKTNNARSMPCSPYPWGRRLQVRSTPAHATSKPLFDGDLPTRSKLMHRPKPSLKWRENREQGQKEEGSIQTSNGPPFPVQHVVLQERGPDGMARHSEGMRMADLSYQGRGWDEFGRSSKVLQKVALIRIDVYGIDKSCPPLDQLCLHPPPLVGAAVPIPVTISIPVSAVSPLS